MDNILVLQEKKTPARTVVLELERFEDGVEIEMSDDATVGIHIRLDVDQAKLLAEFVSGMSA